MIKLKHGVKLRGIRPEMVLGHGIVASVFAGYDLDCIVTSANDSKHGRGSLHFDGSALDYRTRHIPETGFDWAIFMQDIKDALGPEFDVVLESDHIHVEYQPKD